jgi:WD40 repeat protein
MADGTQGVQGPQTHFQRDASKLKVFISYSRDDLKFADQLDAALQTHHYDVAIDRHGISGGEDWKHRLGTLIRDAETVIFVLSPSSAQSPICKWEVEEAARLGKRVLPVVCGPLDKSTPPPKLQDLNYIFFYDEPSAPGSGFGVGLARLVEALNTDVEWVREHTRLLARAIEWDESGRPENRLLFGSVIADAKAWAARRPKNAPELTSLHLDFIRASEAAETLRTNEAHQQLARIAAAQEERARALADKEAEQKHRARLQLFMVAGALVVAFGFAAFGLFSWRLYLTSEARKNEAVESDARAVAQARLAEAKAREAEEQKQLARANLEKEATTAALFRATQAESALKAGDPTTAILLALEALPSSDASDEESAGRVIVPDVVNDLRQALRDLREERILVAHEREVVAVAFSKDGKFLATGSLDKTAMVWKLGDLRQPFHVFRGHSAAIRGVAFSPDGTELVTASDDGTARVWKVGADGGEILTLPHGAAVSSVQFSPNGEEIATGAADGVVRLWKAKDGAIGATLSAHEDEVTSLAFSPDSIQLLSGSADGSLVLWDVAKKRKIRALLENKQPPSGSTSLGNPISEVLSVAFSSDGKRIAGALDDGTVRIWNPETGEREATLEGYEGPVYSVAFSPDGRRIVTGSADHTVRLWSTADPGSRVLGIGPTPLAGGWNQEIFAGHERSVLSVNFSPNGDSIASASGDGTARIWKLDRSGGSDLQQASARELVALAIARVPRCLSAAQRVSLRVASKAKPWCDGKFSFDNAKIAADTESSSAGFRLRKYEWYLMENGIGPGRSSGGINWAGAVRHTTGQTTTIVALVDTGLHRDLIGAGNVLSGYNFVTKGGRSNDPTDPGDACPQQGQIKNSWDGTEVARIIAQLDNPGRGSRVRPLAPKVSVLPVRALGACGGKLQDVADAIRWAAGLEVDNAPRNSTPAQIIAVTLGALYVCTPDDPVGKAVAEAISAGSIVIAPAGNDQAVAAGETPAGCPGVIAIAASDARGHLSWFSNFGEGVAVMAPGSDTSSLAIQGTNAAAAIAVGVVALGLSTHPELKGHPELVLERLKKTALPRTSEECPNGCGAGLLNAEAFVRP